VLILDPPGLAKAFGLDNVNEFSVAPPSPPLLMPAEATLLILFHAGEGPMKAIPLSSISRIESLEEPVVCNSDGTLVIQRHGRLMPLVRVNDASVEPDMAASLVRPVLVIGVGGEPMGLLVSEIVDIVEDHLDIEIAGDHPGVIGSAIIRGEPTEILDVTHFMKIARPDAFSRGHASRFRVLIVDDKQFFRDMLSPIVSAAGYEVSTAASAQEALQFFEKGATFDAVVTDTDMPGMDGYTFARELLQDEDRSDLPVIALAAYAAPAVINAARAAGMRGAVGKFDRAALVTALGAALDGNAFNHHAIESRAISGVAA
jgi:two-component system chemotaxis sensor kinase CheA